MPKHQVSDWTPRKDRGSWYVAEGVFDRTMNRITRGQWPKRLRHMLPLTPEPVGHVRTAATRMDHTVGSIGRRLRRYEYERLRPVSGFPNVLVPRQFMRSPYELRVQTAHGELRTLGTVSAGGLRMSAPDAQDVVDWGGKTIRTDVRREFTMSFEVDGSARDAYRVLAGIGAPASN